MATHTIKEVQRADELWDKMPLEDVAEEMDVKYSWLDYLSKKGMIDTDVDWRAKKARTSQEKIDLVDRLWDRMPLCEASEKAGVPYGTAKGWSSKGWISTDVDWVSEAKEKKSLRRRIANLYYDHGMTGPEIAEEVGLDRSNVYRHLKTYREKGA